jgi:hypothetical protein
MATALPNPRYERKFTSDGLSLGEVLACVRRHPAAFHETYPARWVNNIYFDSPDLRDYNDHINGIAQRVKTRIRWYGPWSGAMLTAALEHKLKSGAVSGKRSQSLPSLAMNGRISMPDLEAAFDRAGLPELTLFGLRHATPSLLNRYQRHYFRSADRRFRLTVDSNLQFAAARPANQARIAFSAPMPLVVIELKFPLAEAEAAAEMTNALPFRLARCSKYVLGVSRFAFS